MNTSVKHWMATRPVSTRPDVSAAKALEQMVDAGIRHLPVVDEARRVIGVLSAEDLHAALPLSFPSGTTAEALGWQVAGLMSHAPVTIRETASVGEAAEVMAAHRIGCLPVVDPGNRLVGLLSETDLLHALSASSSEAPGEAPGLSEPRAHLMEELRREQQVLEEQVASFRVAESEVSERLKRDGVDAEHWEHLDDLGLTMASRFIAEKRLAAIRAGLSRIAEGRFALCEGCGETIPITRLRALPAATTCVTCARPAAA